MVSIVLPPKKHIIAFYLWPCFFGISQVFEKIASAKSGRGGKPIMSAFSSSPFLQSILRTPLLDKKRTNMALRGNLLLSWILILQSFIGGCESFKVIQEQLENSLDIKTSEVINIKHTIRKVKFLSKNSILTKPEHFHEFFIPNFFDNFSREIKVINS